MPRITDPRTAVSTVTDWQKKSIKGHANFPKFTPRSQTSASMPGFNSFASGLDQAQIYTTIPRKAHQRSLLKVEAGMPDSERTLEIRWRYSKELPNFSPDFLYLYLSRFTSVEAIYQQAVNSCIVVLKDASAVWKVVNKKDLGRPYGRLWVKPWNVTPQDNELCRITKFIETISSTDSRFNGLLKRYYLMARANPYLGIERAFSKKYKTHGPSLEHYLRRNLPRNTFGTF